MLRALYPTGDGGGQYIFVYGERKGQFDIMGEMPEARLINPQVIEYGRYINQLDIEQKRKVCVIGKEIYNELFPEGGDPTGKQIRMQSTFLTVVGVQTYRGGVSFGDVNRTAVIPLTMMQQILNMPDVLGVIAVTGEDNANIGELEEQVKALLRERHIISPEDTKAVGGFNIGEEFDRFDSLFRWLTTITWVVGIGTLIAGVVGVSNIMLVVVRERTQEIGVRRALGAPPRKIISQILSESFVLTFIAGLLGLCAAIGALSVIESMFAVNSMKEGMEPVSYMISFSRAMIAAGVVMFGGILSGLIPAYRAIVIKPVDAIREE